MLGEVGTCACWYVGRVAASEVCDPPSYEPIQFSFSTHEIFSCSSVCVFLLSQEVRFCLTNGFVFDKNCVHQTRFQGLKGSSWTLD